MNSTMDDTSSNSGDEAAIYDEEILKVVRLRASASTPRTDSGTFTLKVPVASPCSKTHIASSSPDRPTLTAVKDRTAARGEEKADILKIARERTTSSREATEAFMDKDASLFVDEYTDEISLPEAETSNLRRCQSLPGAHWIEGLFTGASLFERGQRSVADDESGIIVEASNELDETSPVAQLIVDAEPSQVARPMNNEASFRRKKHILLYAIPLCMVLLTIVIFAASICGNGLCSQGETPEIDEAYTYRYNQDVQAARLQKHLEQDLGDGYFRQSESISSPRNKAFQWILNHQANHDNPFLLQRFILALLYFETTENEPWHVCNPPKGNETDTCYYNSFPESRASEPEPKARWLTVNSECLWAGLLCKDGEEVNEIYLKKNLLNGQLPTEMALLSKLQILDFLGNNLHGSLPVELAQLQNLERLALSDNKLEGTLPGILFENLAKLTLLSVRQNPITGTIPTEVGHFRGICLWLRNTHLSGSMPSELLSLTNLQQFGISDTRVVGTIPTEIGNLSNLLQLNLSNNQGFGGTLPEELFQSLSNLRWLELNDCNFSGTLSTSLGHLSKLVSLHIANNDFLGRIPVEMSALSDLAYVSVNGNGFIGSFPNEVCSHLSIKAKVTADCTPDRASGATAMPCECCTHCCDPSTEICSAI